MILKQFRCCRRQCGFVRAYIGTTRRMRCSRMRSSSRYWLCGLYLGLFHVWPVSRGRFTNSTRAARLKSHTMKTVSLRSHANPDPFWPPLASIVGLGPILEPAIAVIWGWGPACCGWCSVHLHRGRARPRRVDREHAIPGPHDRRRVPRPDGSPGKALGPVDHLPSCRWRWGPL